MSVVKGSLVFIFSSPLPNANGRLRINSRTFTCLIDVEIKKENNII